MAENERKSNFSKTSSEEMLQSEIFQELGETNKLCESVSSFYRSRTKIPQQLTANFASNYGKSVKFYGILWKSAEIVRKNHEKYVIKIARRYLYGVLAGRDGSGGQEGSSSWRRYFCPTGPPFLGFLISLLYTEGRTWNYLVSYSKTLGGTNAEFYPQELKEYSKTFEI